MGIPHTRTEEIHALIGVLPESMGFPMYMTGAEYLTYMGRLYGSFPQSAQLKAVELLASFGLSEAAESRIATYSRGMGVLISSFAPSNLVSFTVSFIMILLLAAPNQLPASIKELPVMSWVIALDPITAIAKYQAGILDGTAWNQELGLLISPIILFILIAVLGPGFLNRRLSLQGGFEQ